MKIIVTGATGFLGKYIVRELVQHNHQVIAIGRNQAVLEQLKSEMVEILAIDLLNEKALAEQLPKADVIIHAAALSTVYGKRKDFIDNNVEVTKHLYTLAKQKGISRFVFVSSPSVYTARTDRYNIREEDVDTSNRLNYYIESKLLAEHYLMKQADDTVEVIITRPRGLFGIGDTSIFPRLREANQKFGLPLLKKQGESLIVDVTCVENVAYALRLCAEKDGINKEIFNITNGEPVSFQKMMTTVFQGVGETPRFIYRNPKVLYNIAWLIEKVYYTFHFKKEPPITPYTVCTLAYSQTLNIEKAKRLLGYKPIITIDEGIEQYVEHIKEKKGK